MAARPPPTMVLSLMLMSKIRSLFISKSMDQNFTMPGFRQAADHAGKTLSSNSFFWSTVSKT